MSAIRKGSKVEWNWGKSQATGKVEERFTKKVTRKIKGKSVSRDASKDEPAFLVVQEDGGKVLKSDSELTRV